MWRSCRWWLVLIWLVTTSGVTSKLIGQTFRGNPENNSAGYAGVPASPSQASPSPKPAASEQEEPASGQRKDPTAPAPGANASGSERSLQSFELPAVGSFPETFVLKKEAYQAMKERIEQLERLLQT